MTFWEWLERTRPGVVLALLCVGTLAFYVACLDYGMFRCDNIYHLLGAWGLATGRGYVDVSRPDMPPLLKYPPGYAVAIAPFVGLVGDHLKWLRLVTLVPFVATVPLVYRLLRPRTSHTAALLITALYAVYPGNVWSVYLLGGFPYQVALFPALLVAGHRPKEKHYQRWWPVLLAPLLALAFYVHRISLCLFVAVFTFLLWRREWRCVGIGLGLMTLLVFPYLWPSWTRGGLISPDYEAEIGSFWRNEMRLSSGGWVEKPPGLRPTGTLPLDMARHVVANLRDVPDAVGHAMVPLAGSRHFDRLVARWHLQPLVSGGLLLVAALSLLGWLVEWRRRKALPEWYGLLHTLTISAFFVQPGYFGALLPWLWLYLLRGTQTALAALSSTINHRPSTIDHRLSTINHQPSTISHQPSIWLYLLRGMQTALARFCKPVVQVQWVRAGGFLLLLILLGRCKVYWDSRSWPLSSDRDPRWGWVAQVVQEGEAVYWYGLDNYAWAGWRFFDTGRQAVGVTEQNVARWLEKREPPPAYLAVPRDDTWAPRLSEAGWRQLYAETSAADAMVLFCRYARSPNL